MAVRSTQCQNKAVRRGGGGCHPLLSPLTLSPTVSDLFGLKRMMEKLGQAKTHLEMKKMIREIDSTNKGTICYRDFITMMVGPKNSVLKLYVFFIILTYCLSLFHVFFVFFLYLIKYFSINLYTSHLCAPISF